MTINCWEFKKCGREVDGMKVSEFGVCPAASATEADGFCDGKNGGRGCAFIDGTFCGGVIQGSVKHKEKDCIKCDFFKELQKEYGIKFSVLRFGKYVKNQRPQK